MGHLCMISGHVWKHFIDGETTCVMCGITSEEYYNKLKEDRPKKIEIRLLNILSVYDNVNSRKFLYDWIKTLKDYSETEKERLRERCSELINHMYGHYKPKDLNTT